MLLQIAMSELQLVYRRRSELASPLVFFLMVCTLFPLAISPEQETLRQIAPGVIWVAATLATLLSLDMLFRHDFEDGSLEQLLFSQQPLYVLVLIKLIAYWIFTGVPLVLLSPLLATMMFLPIDAYVSLVISLLLGTPILCLLGSIAAALTVSVKKGGLVLSLLTLPLFMPVLIFGSSAVVFAGEGLANSGQLFILLGLLILTVVLAPFATAVAIKISVGND